MNTVLAALDNSLASKPVIDAARALAALLGAGVEAIHVRVDGYHTASETAAAAHVPLTLADGDVVAALAAAAARDEIVALAIGARGTPAGHRALGGTATAVATAASKPVLIVPPHANVVRPIRRVLVPLEGTRASSLAPSWVFQLVDDPGVEAVVLHVHQETDLPSFTDQPQHEQPAWEHEFVSRYCLGLPVAAVQTRVGRAEEWVPLTAEQTECDLIALGWAQELEAGRAAVVRGTLERTRLPVLLVPVRASRDPKERPALSSATGIEDSAAR
jgi:nucleotide-binding universal stress UspA family protein